MFTNTGPGQLASTYAVGGVNRLAVSPVRPPALPTDAAIVTSMVGPVEAISAPPVAVPDSTANTGAVVTAPSFTVIVSVAGMPTDVTCSSTVDSDTRTIEHARPAGYGTDGDTASTWALPGTYTNMGPGQAVDRYTTPDASVAVSPVLEPALSDTNRSSNELLIDRYVTGTVLEPEKVTIVRPLPSLSCR